MLLILIFISQTVLANPPIPVMPPVKFNDRNAAIDNDDLNIKAACRVATFNPADIPKCVKEYEERKAHFRKESVDFCSSSYQYFATTASKKACIEGVMGKTFNMSALKDCAEKAKESLKSDIVTMKPYMNCFNDPKNLAGGGDVRKGSGQK